MTVRFGAANVFFPDAGRPADDLELCGISCEILLYHQCDLEDDCMIEFTQIETCQLLDLVEAVNQCVSVNEQLSGCLGNVQAVFKELLDGEECLVIEGLDGVLLENFLQECLAEGGGQVIDKSCDTQVIVAYDIFVGIEYLTYFQCGLSLLEGASQILHAYDRCADSDIHLCEEFAGKCIGDGACQLFEVAHIDVVLYFLYENDVVLCNVEHEVLVLIGEQVLDNIISRNIVGGDNVDEEHNSADVGIEVQLTRFQADIAGKDIIEDDVLYKVVSVILFIVVLLDAGKRDCDNACILCGRLVRALYEYCVIRLNMNAERLVGIAVADEYFVRIAKLDGEEVVSAAHSCEITAGNDGAVFIDNTDNAVYRILHLMNNTLEQSV